MLIETTDVEITGRFRRDVGDITALAESIAAVGLLHPIVVTKDLKLVCGERRLRAVRDVLGLAKIEATIIDLDGDDLLVAERDENEQHKPFTLTERVEIGKAIEERLAGRRGSNQHATKVDVQNFAQADEGEKTRAIAARRAGFGNPETYRQAKQVVASGTPALVKAVESGKVAVSTAATIAKAPPAKQEQVATWSKEDIVREANRIKREEKQAKREERERIAVEVAAALPAASSRWRVVKAPVAELTQIEDQSVDCIITDPPYPREFLPVYADLGRTAARVLKPGASCFVMIGQSYLPEIIDALGQSLTYHWALAYLTPGGQAVQVWPRKVNTFWKPVLWFTNGELSAKEWRGDVAQSKTNDNDKRFHHWGQSESGMADLVTRCSAVGDTILDPFCGAGTTGVVALALDRLFIGADVDQAAIDRTISRLSEGVANVA